MNETPPPPPNKTPLPLDEIPPPPPPPNRSPLTRWQAFGIGLAIFAVSAPLCLLNPIFGFLGLAAAVTSLFFQGYRHIFTGYILVAGVGLLIAIIYCFATFRVD